MSQVGAEQTLYWIGAPIEDREFLESLGCVLGEHDGDDFRNCTLDLDQIDVYHGHYFWGPEVQQ